MSSDLPVGLVCPKGNAGEKLDLIGTAGIRRKVRLLFPSGIAEGRCDADGAEVKRHTSTDSSSHGRKLNG